MVSKKDRVKVAREQQRRKVIEYTLLIIILLGVLAVKIFLVGQTPFPNYDSYYGMRQVEEIIDTGSPDIMDEYSYQGRVNLTNLAFYYTLALLQLFIPAILLFKYFSILLSLISLVLVYRIAKTLFPERWIPVLLTAITALTPSIFVAHLNTVIPSALFVVLYLFLLRQFFNLERKKHVAIFTIVIILATLISSLTLVFLGGLLLYLVLVRLEGLKLRRREVELVFFATLFAIWYHLIIYKKLFLTFGGGAFWQNIPKEYLLNSFQGLTVPLAISLIGIIPLVLGLFAVYYALFRVRNKRLLLLVSLFFSFSLVTWFGILPLQEGLLYMTLTLVLLSGYTLRLANDFLDNTILTKAKPYIAVTFLLLLVVGFLPVLIYQQNIRADAPSNDEIETLQTMSEFLPEDATLLGHLKEGHVIAAVAKRKNFYDENFAFAPSAIQRYEDAKKIYLSKSTAGVLDQLQYYNIEYIYESRHTKEQYPRTSNLFNQTDCFWPVYETPSTMVYRITCELEN